VLVDDAAGELLVCASDLGFVGRPRVVAFDLKTGAEVARYEFPAAGACSDLARDGAGALYVTDIAAGVIYRAAPGARSLAPWSAPAELAPTAPGQFTANGIAVVGPSLFVVSFATGRLVRIGIGPNGAPGAPVEIAVTPRLELPDGLRRLDDGGLLVAEGVGRLTRLTVLGGQASGEVLAAGLDAPSSVAVAGRQAWVSEGQVRRFFGTDPTPPNLPFRVRRLGLF
jgi:sugar lactone lactonase YvrE